MKETSSNARRVILVAGSTLGLPEVIAELIQVIEEDALVQVVHPSELHDRCISPYLPDLVVLTNYNIPGMDTRSMVWGMDALGINVLVLISAHTYRRVTQFGTVTVMPKMCTFKELEFYIDMALISRLYSHVLLPDQRKDRMVS